MMINNGVPVENVISFILDEINKHSIEMQKLIQCGDTFEFPLDHNEVNYLADFFHKMGVILKSEIIIEQANDLKKLCGEAEISVNDRMNLFDFEREMESWDLMDYLSPTNIGSLIKPSVGGITINKILHSINFHTKSDNGWILTQKGKEFGKQHTGKDDSKFIRWDKSIIKLIIIELNNNTNFTYESKYEEYLLYKQKCNQNSNTSITPNPNLNELRNALMEGEKSGFTEDPIDFDTINTELDELIDKNDVK